MGTRSSISVQVGDKIKSIYCHWDGYLSWNGKILLENYNSQELAEKLIALGDLSSLNKSPDKPEGHTYDTPVDGYCVAYGRDRGEKNTEARSYTSMYELKLEMNEEYNYYWDGTQWTVDGKILTKKIVKED